MKQILKKNLLLLSIIIIIIIKTKGFVFAGCHTEREAHLENVCSHFATDWCSLLH